MTTDLQNTEVSSRDKGGWDGWHYTPQKTFPFSNITLPWIHPQVTPNLQEFPKFAHLLWEG